MKIYKIIHGIWLQGFSEIPQDLCKYIKINKKMNPDWTYEFWDETRIIQLMEKYSDN